MGVIWLTTQAKSAAAATPPTQPRPAHRVLREKPVSISREAAAVSAAMSTADQMGSAPLNTMGMRRNQIPARV